ncbi:MAG: SGNH/GDSL hydrolase family protein [bacterium]
MRLHGGRLVALLARTVVGLALLEVVVRLAAGLGLVSLPAGGIAGLDLILHGRDASDEVRLLVPDRHLIQRMRPLVELDYPRTLQLDGRPQRYTVRTNPQGFRGSPFDTAKAPGVFRIVCLGDSSTFGFNVEESDSYPAVLQRLLDESHPGRFEVINLGVPGYSGRQGLELLRRQALALSPDLVTFGFGTNDRFFPAPMTDDALMRFQDSPTGAALYTARALLDRSYVYRLLKRMVDSALPRPKAGGGEKRVTLDGIAENIAEVQTLVSAQGASLLVLNHDLAGTDAVQGMRTGTQRAAVPLLDMQAALLAAKQQRGAALAATLGLPAAPAMPPGRLLVRVHAPGRDAVEMEYERLLRPAQKLALRDDGGGDDQVSGDAVFSGSIAATTGEWFFYHYGAAAPGGPLSEFPRREVFPMKRIQFVPADGVAALDEFADPVYYADSSHTDEAGHRLFAERLRDAVLATPAVQAILAKQPGPLRATASELRSPTARR